MKLYDVLDDLSWESYRDINLHHSWHNFSYLYVPWTLIFLSVSLTVLNFLAGSQDEMKEREKKKFQNGYRMKSSKILKGGKIEILRSRNFGIVICIRERKWLMMPNFVMTSCCCRGADFRDFLGFNTFFFTFSLSNHFIRWLRMPILPLVVTMIGLSNLIKSPFWIRIPNF
jgi:hypothetical protein